MNKCKYCGGTEFLLTLHSVDGMIPLTGGILPSDEEGKKWFQCFPDIGYPDRQIKEVEGDRYYLAEYTLVKDVCMDCL